MKRTLLIAGTLIWMLGGCRSETADREAGQTNGLAITFQCEPLPGESADTLYSIYAVIQEYKIKLGETTPCSTIPPDRFAELGVPAAAVSAAGSIDGMQGICFYAERAKDRLLIYRGELVIESPPGPEDYRLIATYEDGKFDFLK